MRLAANEASRQFRMLIGNRVTYLAARDCPVAHCKMRTQLVRRFRVLTESELWGLEVCPLGRLLITLITEDLRRV
jgi:hypothetical protein